jgi:hypothetical protein
VVVLLSWLALSVIVVALLNLAKMITRSSARRKHTAVSARGQVPASGDRGQSAAPSFDPSPLRQPGSVALPAPQATHRSA